MIIGSGARYLVQSSRPELFSFFVLSESKERFGINLREKLKQGGPPFKVLALGVLVQYHEQHGDCWDIVFSRQQLRYTSRLSDSTSLCRQFAKLVHNS